MKESFIFSKKPTPRERELIVRDLKQYGETTVKPFEGELEKTSEETEFIITIGKYLIEEFKELGIDNKPTVPLEKIHILSHGAFLKRSPNENLRGFVSYPENAVFVDKEACSHRLDFYAVIFHEILHLLAFRKVYVDLNEKQTTTKQYRSGYYTKNPKESAHEHFRGLEEAVIEKTVIEIFRKHEQEVIRDFNITQNESNLSVGYQSDYVEILDTIIKKIAEKNNEDEQSVWNRFKKGQFTGKMMHLRDIEQTFGKGSLRVLATLGSGTKNLPRAEICKKILRYFETDDKKEKGEIVREVLIERERLRIELINNFF